MKKVINGKMYNTETAKLMADYTSTGGVGDLDYYYLDLYRKKTGEFFEYHYASIRSGGKDEITPLSEKEARHWVEKYCDGQTYEAIFGPVSE